MGDLVKLLEKIIIQDIYVNLIIWKMQKGV